MILKQRFSNATSRIGRRTRVVLLIAFILSMVLMATVVPQFSVSACSGTGYCTCPGC